LVRPDQSIFVAAQLGKNCYPAAMSATATILASGNGWRVSDVVCTAGPRDRPFEECHDSVCIAVVTAGSFRYRGTTGTATLSPGSLLLGNHGACFECGHEHAVGDRCLAFHYAPDAFEEIVAAVPGARTEFDRPRLPPLHRLSALLVDAELACRSGEPTEIEEVSLRLAGAVLEITADRPRHAAGPDDREIRGIVTALRRIEADSHVPLTLDTLAGEARMSRFHFLRVFRRIVGLTPYQYLLRTRLHRAAVRLRRADDPVTSIAFECGFSDLSTFNRRFRAIMGTTPTRYRANGSRRPPGSRRLPTG
jgi:AraC-like DNA-binding protein